MGAVYLAARLAVGSMGPLASSDFLTAVSSQITVLPGFQQQTLIVTLRVPLNFTLAGRKTQCAPAVSVRSASSPVLLGVGLAGAWHVSPTKVLTMFLPKYTQPREAQLAL